MGGGGEGVTGVMNGPVYSSSYVKARRRRHGYTSTAKGVMGPFLRDNASVRREPSG